MTRILVKKFCEKKNMHRIILITFPKAGTYLTKSVLEFLGLEFTGLHLQTSHFTNYAGASYLVARYHPELLKKNVPLWKSLKRIKDNQFAVGHIAFSTRNRLTLATTPKILQVREVRSCLVSYFAFLRETGRQKSAAKEWFHIEDLQNSFAEFLVDQGRARIQMYAALARWKTEAQIPTVRFEWLKEGDYTSLARTFNKARLLKREVVEPAVAQAVESAFAAQTVTKSESNRTSMFGEVWTETAEEFFIDNGGVSVNLQLGYTG